MRRFITTILAAAAMLAGQQMVSAQTNSQRERLYDHLYYLASDQMQGRKAGSADARVAADYIMGQFRDMGLDTFYEDWFQDFTVDGVTYRNVVGLIEGTTKWDEYIVIGAHYDHLGIKKDKIYNGADDNASGTSALIEVARQLQEHRGDLKCSVIIAAFDAEEIGLFGSRELSNALKAEGIKVKMMMSVDMVGWYAKNGTLNVEGVKTIADGKAIVESEAYRAGISVKTKDFEDSALTATDTEYFAKAGIPTLAISTGLKSPYHKPEDDADLIDYVGLDKVTDFVSRLTMRCASDDTIEASGKLARKHVSDDKTVRFKGGLRVGAGSSSIRFRPSGFNSKGSVDISLGLGARLDWKKTGIRATVLMENDRTYLPDPEDYLFSRTTYDQSALTVPVEILYQPIPGALYLGIGPCYSRILNDVGIDFGKVVKDQWGLSFSAGFTIGHMDFEFSLRNDFSSLLEPEMPTHGDELQKAPKAFMRVKEFGIIYNF